MTNLSVIDTAYQLSLAADKATDSAIHEDVAKIVKLHAKISLGIAIVPIPGADIAAMVANTWTMYVRINKTLGIPFSENMLKSLASGIATNLLSNVPMLLTGSVLKTIPFVGQIGGAAIMAGTMYAVTIAAGVVYMKALAMLLNCQSELTEVNLKAVIDSVVTDKDAMKKIIKDASQQYKVDKAAGSLS